MENLPEGGEWSVYLALFVAGGFPWITQIKALDIHFCYKGVSYKEVFNAFASLFSFSIFFFMKTAVTDRFAFYFDYWPLIILFAFVLVVIYVGLLMHNKENRKLGGVLFGFALYVLVFCTLVTGFSLLYFEKDYHMISGTVAGVKGEIVTIEVYDATVKLKEVETDEDGDFHFALRKGVNYHKVDLLYKLKDSVLTSTKFIYDPIYSSFSKLTLPE